MKNAEPGFFMDNAGAAHDLYYFYGVDIKRKKNIVSVVGFVIGFTAGLILHHHGLGIAFGIMLGLVAREIYD